MVNNAITTSDGGDRSGGGGAAPHSAQACTISKIKHLIPHTYLLGRFGPHPHTHCQVLLLQSNLREKVTLSAFPTLTTPVTQEIGFDSIAFSPRSLRLFLFSAIRCVVSPPVPTNK